jgi:hypothetical protein
MSNCKCVACNQMKKEENFSIDSLAAGSPMCSVCELKAFKVRIEGLEKAVVSMKKQQQTVRAVSNVVEVPSNKGQKKKSSSLFLSSILSKSA